MFLSSDKTPKEMQYYKEVKKELEERKNNGEENITIKFVNNIPKIVENLN